MRWFLLFLLPFTAIHAQPSTVDAGRFTVRILNNPRLHAEVTATYALPAHELRMGTGAIDQLPDKWGTFVSDFKARDASGREVGVAAVRDSALGRVWRSSGTNISSVSYVVDLSFTQSKWPPGNEQAGLWTDSALFLVTKSLFVAPDRAGSWKVSFDLPSSWKIAQAWSSAPAGARTFTAPSLSSLFYNTIVVGKYGDYQFLSGDFDVTLALIGRASQGAPALRRTFEPVLKEYVRIFQSTPKTKYLMTVFYGDEEDGEGFETSAAFRTTVPIIDDTRIMWGNTLAHELLHMWNGHKLRGDTSALSEWLQEGFTEYMANRALLKTGMITPDDFMRKTEVNLSLYSYFRTSGHFDSVSVRKSGTRKWTYRFGVYNGGWAAAFALDQTLRESTGERRNIEDLMRLLYQRYVSQDKPWTYQGLIAASSELAGADLSSFFNRYIDGLEPLPLEKLSARLGYSLVGHGYGAELYLRPLRDAPAADKARGRQYFQRP